MTTKQDRTLNTFVSIDGLVIDTNNGDYGDAQTYYTYFNLLADGYDSFSAHHIITATTVTYEGTNDDLSVADASANWHDITTMLTDDGGTTTEFTSTGALTISVPIPWGRIRIKAVTTNATNALEVRMSRLRISA